MHLHLLDGVVHGYEAIEPVVVGLMALQRSLMLIGRHGTGKTTVARALAGGYGPDGFAFYDATKDDLISIAGIPDPDGLRAGALRFVPHQRSLWDKTTLVVDELTRAGRESQNLWLEVLEARTCFGIPLPYRALIATANPESYAAAFALDEALLDRFHAIVPVPEQQDEVGPAQVAAMVRLATARGGTLAPAAVQTAFGSIRAAHDALLAEGALERVTAYLARLVPALLSALREGRERYLSPRTYARSLPETLLAAASYYRAAGAPDALTRGARDALRYAVATRLQLKTAVVDGLHAAAAALLERDTPAEAEGLRLELLAPRPLGARLDFLRNNWPALGTALNLDEIEKVVGGLLRDVSVPGGERAMLDLRATLTHSGYRGDALRQLDGRLLLALGTALRQALARAARILAAPPPGIELESLRGALEALRERGRPARLLASNRPAGDRTLDLLLEPPADDARFAAMLGAVMRAEVV